MSSSCQPRHRSQVDEAEILDLGLFLPQRFRRGYRARPAGSGEGRVAGEDRARAYDGVSDHPARYRYAGHI